MLTKVRAYFADNPARIRTAVLAVLGLVAFFAPGLTELTENATLIGSLVDLVSSMLG